MNTRRERFEKTCEVIMDEEVVGYLEGLIHLYYWGRFEMAISRRSKQSRLAAKYAEKLNTNLDIFEFRKEIQAMVRDH